MSDDPRSSGVAAEAARAALYAGLAGMDMAPGTRDSQGSGALRAANDAKEGDGKMNKLMRSYVLLEIEHSKTIPDITDIVAGRVYTLDKVENTTATLLDSKTAYWMAVAQKEGV